VRYLVVYDAVGWSRAGGCVAVLAEVGLWLRFCTMLTSGQTEVCARGSQKRRIPKTADCWESNPAAACFGGRRGGRAPDQRRR